VSRCMLLVLLLGSFSLFISACDTSALPATSRPSATATLSLSNVAHFSLGNFQASSLLSMAHGLLVFGTPGSVGQTSDTPPSQDGMPKALYYYATTTQTFQRIVSIPDTSEGRITSVTAAGDWVIYTKGIDPTSFEDVEQTWAFNVATHEQQSVAT